jgi:hypothetical protein
MKTLKYLFIALAIILSDIMCAVVAYNYRDLLCRIGHGGFSAPAEIAFLLAIPFLAAIIACIILAIVFHRKSVAKAQNTTDKRGV